LRLKEVRKNTKEISRKGMAKNGIDDRGSSSESSVATSSFEDVDDVGSERMVVEGTTRMKKVKEDLEVEDDDEKGAASDAEDLREET
jgi:hypothetical protein